MISNLFLKIMRGASALTPLRSVFGAVAGLLLCCTIGYSTCVHADQIQAAFTAMQAGGFETAVTLLSRLESAAPTCDPEQYHLLAIAWLNLRENDKALRAVERGLEAFPASTDLQAYYVSVLASVSANSDAILRLDRALALTPQSTILKKALAKNLLDADSESERAGKILVELVRELPRDVECRGDYARYLSAVHRDAEAERQLVLALRDAPDSPEIKTNIYRLLAVVEDRLNHEQQAEDAYRKAIACNAKRATPSYSAELEYAEYLMRRSRYKQAENVLTNLLSIYASAGPAYLDLARISARADEYDDAIKEASRALEISPDKAAQRTIRIFLAKTYHSAGRDDEARVQEDWLVSH